MKKLIQNSSLNLALLGLATLPAVAQQTETKPARPNVLFIAVDDLKPLIAKPRRSMLRCQKSMFGRLERASMTRSSKLFIDPSRSYND